MGSIPQLLTAGLAIGAVYALLATGFIVIYRSTGVINFAQGDLATVGAFLALWALRRFDVTTLIAYVLAVGAMAVLGILLFKVVYSPLRHQSVVTISIGTLGVALALRGGLLVAFGPEPAGLASPVGDGSFHIAGVVVTYQQLLIVGLTAALIAVQALVFNYTVAGHSLRAIAEDQEMATVLGIRVDRLLLAAFAYSAGLAALAGILLAPSLSVSLNLGWSVTFTSFIAAIVGGLGSLAGAVAGGIAIGMVQTFGQFYVSGPFGTSLTFGVLLIILLIRPNGVFSMATAQKV